MNKFTKSINSTLGLITVIDEDGRVVAEFASDSIAYGAFVSGLSNLGRTDVFAGVSLYDADTDQFIVGTVAELVG